MDLKLFCEGKILEVLWTKSLNVNFGSAGALTLASVLLYPKKLGGGAVFSGWVPFGSSVTERISPEARKVINIFIPLSLLFSLMHHHKMQGSLDIWVGKNCWMTRLMMFDLWYLVVTLWFEITALTYGTLLQPLPTMVRPFPGTIIYLRFFQAASACSSVGKLETYERCRIVIC